MSEEPALKLIKNLKHDHVEHSYSSSNIENIEEQTKNSSPQHSVAFSTSSVAKAIWERAVRRPNCIAAVV